MKLIKKIIKWAFYIASIPIVYFIVSMILSSITIEQKAAKQAADKSIYLSTNGVHLDIVIALSDIDSLLRSGLSKEPSENYLSFGWGDENFYINTPTWADLSFRNAFKALFLKSSSLMHVTRYRSKQPNWLEVKVSEDELRKLNAYIFKTFKLSQNGSKIVLHNQGYTSSDNFYKAQGSYSCLKTCNSWVNTGFKESGLKSCLWTPFDFGLINKYE